MTMNKVIVSLLFYFLHETLYYDIVIVLLTWNECADNCNMIIFWVKYVFGPLILSENWK